MSQIPEASSSATMPQPPVRKKQSFGLHWSCGIALLIGLVAFVVLGIDDSRTVPPGFVAGEIVGTALGMAILAFLPALIAFFVCGRSRLAASIVFVLVIGMGVMGQAITKAQRAKTQAASQAMMTTLQQAKQTVQQEMKSGNPDMNKVAGAMDSMTDSAEKAAKDLNPGEAAAARALAAFLGKCKEQMVAHQKHIAIISEKTPLNPGWMKDKSDVSIVREEVAKFQATNRQMRSFYGGIMTTLREECAKQKVPSALQEQMMVEVGGKFTRSRALIAKIRDQDDEMAKTLLECCDVLESNWGTWRMRDNTVVFEDGKAAGKFNELCQRMRALAAEQQQAQAENLSAMK